MRGLAGFIAAVSGVLLLLSVPTYANNGIEDIGSTVRQLSRGGTFIAAEPEAGALMGNPAALAFLDRAELYGDLRVWGSSLDYSGALNGLGQKERYVLPNLAYAEPVGDRFAWGAGVFTAVNSAYRVHAYDLSVLGSPAGLTDRTSTKVRFVLFAPGLAYKLSDNTSIGASLHYTNGSADFQAYNMLGQTLGFSLGNLSGDGWALRAGIYHRASEDTVLGAYWRSRTHLDIHDGVLQVPPTQPQQAPAQIPGTSVKGFQFPEQYGVGISQQLGTEWTALAEYRRLLWGEGSSEVSFIPSQGDPFTLAMGWSNQDVFACGAEYRPDGTNNQIWRFGVNYAESPVPDHTLNPLYPAISEWHYTAGWEQKLDDQVSLVTGAVYTPQVTRSSSADNTFNTLLGAGQPYTLSTDGWQFGLGLSWSFGKHEDDCAAEVIQDPGPDCYTVDGVEYRSSASLDS
ncbi:outer membrane protein transport protein [bacterium]|nr:outer membrane protein transport protein [bacterium]